MESPIPEKAAEKWTTAERETYLANLERLDKVAFDQFESDDFFTDENSVIFNKYFFDGCELLFVAWCDDMVTPVMVYNKNFVDKLPADEVKKDWVNMWDVMFYKRPGNGKDLSRKVYNSIIDKMQSHVWWFIFGMY